MPRLLNPDRVADGFRLTRFGRNTHRRSVMSDSTSAVQSSISPCTAYPISATDNHLEYLSLSESERALACSRPGLHAQVYCALQIGYFKAKHAFFRFTWAEKRIRISTL